MTEFPRPDSIQEAEGFLREVDGAERGQLLKSFLWQALSQRDWKLAAFVMEHDRTLVSSDASVYGPLYDALSLFGDCSVVIAWLLDHGADLEQRSHNNWT